MSNAKRTMAIFGRRATTVVLSALMVFSSVPTAALAEEWEEAQELAAQLSEQDTSVDNGDTAANENTEQAAQPGEESSQSESGSDTSSAEQSSGEQEASNQSSEQATQADIALSGLDYATVKLADGQSLSTGSTKVTVPTSADFKFTVEANSGYSLKAVKLTVNGVERELTADDNGYYTIPAADILSGASLALETEEASDAANNSTSTTSITSEDESDDQGSRVNKLAAEVVSSVSGPTAVTTGESATQNYNLKVNGNDTLEAGKLAPYTAAGFSGDVAWSTSDSSIATVDANGVVTAVAKGNVDIIATYGTEVAKKSIEVTEPSSASGRFNATFTSTIENADVVYFNWHNSSDVSNVAFAPATNSFTVNNYTTTTESGYVVFFVKPDSNHIITGLGASGAGQMYAVDATSWGAINGYPGISTVMAAAKAAGYVAAFGYSRAPRNSMSQSFDIAAKSPDMTIAATSSQTKDVAAGDELTFTVTIAPQTTGSGRDSVTGVRVNSAEVNGTEVTVEKLTQNSDGTYTGYVHYTATDNDCSRGSVVLTVEATTTYEGSYTITSGGITTGAEVTKSATCACQIAPESQVKYQFVSGTSGMALPSAINDFLPWDNDSYAAGKTVKAKDPSQTEYADSKNDGYWTFAGWDQNSVKVGRKGETVTFTGTWSFTKYSKYTINYVDEDGNKIAESKTVGQKKVGEKVKASEVEKPEIEGYAYNKTSSDITIAADESENIITVTYKQKTGKAGYNLVLVGASWNAPEKTTNTEKMKWYFDYGFAKGDTFTVTNSEPAAADHVFIGWMDKERGDQGAAIRKAGDTVTYCYSNNQTYTLDALWASLSATGEDVTYDGKSHTVTVDVEINNGTGLDEKYVEQAKKLITAGDIQYSTNGGETWSADKPSFKDAGTYTVQVKQDVTVGGVTTTLTAETQVKIAQKEYFVKTNTESKTYDGSKLVGTATVEGLVAGESAAAAATTVGPNVTASTKNAVTGEIVWAEGTKSSNYKRGTDDLGTLVITKRDVTLASASDEKAYDGTALTNDTVTVGGNGFVNGEGATYRVTGSQTSIGSSDNAFTYALNSNTKAENYNITKSEGKLTVRDRDESEKYEITVEGSSTSVTYDGAEHSAAGITEASKAFTNDKGATFTVAAATTDPTSTDVTTKTNKVSNVKVADADGNDVTSQFKVTTKDGSLTIAKKSATITAGSAEKEYDGKALTTNEFSTDGFVKGQGIASATIEGSQTVAGTSYSTVKDNSWKAQNGTDLKNYEITTRPGTLTVKDRTAKYEITLEGVTETKTYNGADQTMYGVKSDEFEIDGVKYKVYNYKSDVTGKDAGDYVQTITSTNKDGSWTIKDAEGNDVSGQFSVTTKPGKLTIAPKEVTITSGSDTKTYDGTALTKNEASVTAGGFVKGEDAGVSYTYSGSQTNVGSSDNAFEVVFDGTKAKARNYNVTKKPGALTVNAVTDKVTVTITEHSDAYTYDGTEKTVTGYDVSSSNVLYTASCFSFSFSGNATVTGADAGTYNMELKPSDFNNTSTNFTNVEFVIVDGALTISPRHVTLTSASASKTYDGSALTNKSVTVGGQGFATGQGASYDVTGTITNAGSVDNEFNYTLNEGAKAENYSITKAEGKLTVTPVTDAITVTITGKTDSGTYNGKAQGVEGYDVSISGSTLYTESLVKFSGTAKAEGTDAGTYNMGLMAEQFSNAEATNFTNVTFKVASDGSYTINKADVTLKSADLSKTYDGDALTNDETALAAETGWAEGESAAYTFTGSQTAPGSSANAFSYALNDGTKESNYNITKTEGTLTVTSRGASSTITVKAKSATATYDGKEHEAAGVETYEFTVDGKKYTVSGLSTEDPKKVNAGTYSNNITGTPVVTDADGHDVTSEFAVKTENGSLTINKAVVTLKSASGEWTYNGTAHSKNEMETVSGFAEGEGASFTYGASVTNVSEGEVKNTFAYTLNANTNANNYEITTEVGTLKVSPVSDKVTVTVTEKSGSFEYDGVEHSVEGYTYKSSNRLYGESCFSFVGEADHKVAKGTAVGRYDMKLVPSDFENVSANFSNVEFVVKDGQLEITPAAIDENNVVWTKQDLTKVYDAKALTAYAATAADKYGNKLCVEFSTDDKTWTTSANDVSLTHAGSVTVYLRATNDNYSEGSYATATETITVSKRKVTIASDTASKQYDGTPLTNGQIILSSYDYQGGNGFVSGEGVNAEATGTITNVGETSNTIKWSFKSNTQPGDYDVTVTPGTLTVTADASEVVVTVKGNSESVVYDGEEHTVSGYEVVSITGGEGRFTKDDVTLNEGVDLSVSGTNVAVDENGNVVAYVKALHASDFKSANGNFSNVKFVVDSSAPSVSLTVTKRPVTLTSGSDEKAYDGTPLTNSEVTATEFGDGVGFVDEQGFTATTTGAQTNAGTSKNTFEYGLKANTSAINYSITKAEGDLTVTKLAAANLNLKGTDVTAIYDARSHAAGTATVAPKDNDGNDLNVDVTIEYQLASDPDRNWYKDPSAITQKHATTDPVVVNVRASSSNFYGYATASETITVTKRPVQISTKSASKVYDGTALTTKNDWDGYEIKPYKDGGFIYDDYVIGSDGYPILECTGSQTEVGSSTNTINYQIKSDRLDDYNIISEPSLGTLKVTAQSIDPSSSDYTGAKVNDPSDSVYNGTANKWEPTVTDAQGKTLAKGTDYTVAYKRGDDATDDFTNAGTITVTITGQGNYAGSVTKTYKVTPAPLKVSTPDATKVYDGTALTAAATSANISGLVAGETATVKATGSITEVGSTTNTYSGIEWGSAKESNYYVQSQSEGTLKVLAQSIDPADPDKRYDGATVNDPSDTTYDGQTHQWEPTVKNGKGKTLTEGTDYTVTYKRGDDATDDFTNAGTITVTITGKGNYAGSVTKTYVINKAKVSVATAGASKVYDGTALTKADGATISGLVAGETAGIVGTGSITEVGSTPNTYAITWAGEGNSYTAKESNYEVSGEALGTLSITESADEIVVTTTGGEFTYDGKTHGATVTVGALPTGYSVKTASSNATATDVTEGVTATADNLVIVNASGKDVTSSLNIKKVDGTIKVNPAPLTVTTYGNTKAYDGTALTAGGKIEGLVNQEAAELVTNGSITEVGETKNTYTINWNDSAKQSNYKVVTENIGTLKVTPATTNLFVVPVAATKVYDGKALTSSTANVYGSLPKGYTYEYTLKGSQTEVGTGYVEVDTFKILNKDGKDVTSQFSGYNTEFKNTLTVTQRPVTVTSANGSKAYDGSALEAHSATASEAAEGTGMVEGESFDFDYTGSQTEKGSSSNYFTAKDSATAKVSNYKVTYVYGTLEVKAQSIEPGTDPEPNPDYKGVTVSDPSNTTYDGQAHKWEPEVKDANGNALAKGADYTVTYKRDGQATTNFTDAGTITVEIAGTGNYSGTVTKTYVISPKGYSVTTESASKVYDNTPLTAPGKVEGIVDGETYTLKMTGSRTEVGTSDNTYEILWNGTAKQGNYVRTSEQIGKLTVTEYANEIVVTTTGGTSTYDGQAHGATVAVTGLPEGYRVQTAASSASATDVTDAEGVTATADELVIMNGQGQDVTGKLNITKVDGTIKVTPATLTVVTSGAVKPYDGTALTNADIRVDGLRGNDAVSAATTGSITEVGSATNTYAIDWLETDKNNYTVTENLGELVVTAAAVVPNTPGNSPASPDGTVIDAIADALADTAAAITGEQDGEQIFDAENPLGKNEHAACWVHFYMIIGMVVTLLYGLSVDVRRRRFSGKLAGQLNDVLGGTEGSEA